MLFSRRTPQGWRERLRIALWPRRSWSRSVSYVTKRVLRLSASPHALAAGVAAGVFASFTPFLGFHFLIAFAVAYVIAGNMIAAAMGTFVGNPLTFPLIWASTYETGRIILSEKGGGSHHRIAELADTDMFDVGVGGMFDRIVKLWEPVLEPMLVGAIPLGVLFAIVFYVLTRWAVTRFRAARQKRLAARLKATIAPPPVAGNAPAADSVPPAAGRPPEQKRVETAAS